MSFDYIHEEDKIRYLTFNKLIKNSSSGEFMTKGQYYANYVKAFGRDDYAFLKENFGVDASHGQKVLTVNAHFSVNHWVVVPITWAFVIDEVGLIRKYKIGGDGNLRVGWKPNASKTVLQFERSSTPERQEWLVNADKPDPYIDESEQVMTRLTGIPSGRQRIKGRVLTIKEAYERDKFGNMVEKVSMMVLSRSGVKYYGTAPKSIRHDDHFKRGAIVEFSANVKETSDLDFAVYGRPSKAEIVEKVE